MTPTDFAWLLFPVLGLGSVWLFLYRWQRFLAQWHACVKQEAVRLLADQKAFAELTQAYLRTVDGGIN